MCVCVWVWVCVCNLVDKSFTNRNRKKRFLMLRQKEPEKKP